MTVQTGRHGTKVNFSAVTAGTLMTLAFGVLFWLLGNALGLGTINLISSTATGVMKTGTWVYDFVTFCTAFYIGGYGTARLGMFQTQDSAVFHALTAWSLSLAVATMAGFLFIPSVAQAVLGMASSEVNWLLVFVSAIGSAGAVIGGLAAHAITRPMGIRRVEDEHIELERKAG